MWLGKLWSSYSYIDCCVAVAREHSNQPSLGILAPLSLPHPAPQAAQQADAVFCCTVVVCGGCCCCVVVVVVVPVLTHIHPCHLSLFACLCLLPFVSGHPSSLPLPSHHPLLAVAPPRERSFPRSSLQNWPSIPHLVSPSSRHYSAALLLQTLPHPELPALHALVSLSE